MNKHNNSCWYELYALSTLQVVFPLEFQNFRLSDRPDLMDYDAQLGIEVIRPVDEKHEMLNSYFQNYLYGKTINQRSPKGLKKFQSNSYDIMFNSQDHSVSAYQMPYKTFDIATIYRAIDKKMRKLNNNLYACSNNISLFLEMSMYSKELENPSIAKEILIYIKEIEREYAISFNEVFLDCIIKLYRINIKTGEIIIIDTFDLIDSIKLKYEKNRTKEEGRDDQYKK